MDIKTEKEMVDQIYKLIENGAEQIIVPSDMSLDIQDNKLTIEINGNKYINWLTDRCLPYR